jgi:hypothetical protein
MQTKSNKMVSIEVANKVIMVQQWQADIIRLRERLKLQARFLAQYGGHDAEETMSLINAKIRHLNGKINANV